MPHRQVLDIVPGNQIHPLVPFGYELAEFAQLPCLRLSETRKVAVHDLEIEFHFRSEWRLGRLRAIKIADSGVWVSVATVGEFLK